MKKYMEQFSRNLFAFDSKDNILTEECLGITGDISSLLTPEHSVTKMECFQGCPYTATSFSVDTLIGGERIKASSWKWLPNAIWRKGECKNFTVDTLTAMVPGTRAAVQRITVKSKLTEELKTPITVMYRGRAGFEDDWKFYHPEPLDCRRDDFSADGNVLISARDRLAFALTSSLPDMRNFSRAYLWENEIAIPAKGEITFYFSAHLGREETVRKEAAHTSYEQMLEQSFAYLEKETDRIHNNVPRLTSDSPSLDKLYYRSLVTYILCRWENPDLKLNPYFSTGSINGSCMCSYLWDYCGGLMLHPLYDPEGNKKQLLSYLKNDLTKSYALNPVTGGALGPWYQINQEKITMMVYHHVRATGDVDFLFQKAGDKTVLEWMRYYAYVCDDLSKEAELYDYGLGGDDHLELMNWGNGPYNGVMPDLNARRYLNYMRAYELTVVAGQPDELLPKRAAKLKEKLKTLWNEEAQWYDFIDADGNRDIRYTVQMFKFLNSEVIGKKERDGLVSHLNEEEFLSKFGLHSMSKLDPQYDQDDIDNGGGGICTHFTAHICAQLYQMGYDAVATDILKRIYWWGERLPYMGDSCTANFMSNRQGFLQGDISSTAFAQMIFFFIFGITPHFDGSVTISPVKNRPAENMRIEGARLCGKTFSVEVEGDRFTVALNGKTITANIGETVTI